MRNLRIRNFFETVRETALNNILKTITRNCFICYSISNYELFRYRTTNYQKFLFPQIFRFSRKPLLNICPLDLSSNIRFLLVVPRWRISMKMKVIVPLKVVFLLHIICVHFSLKFDLFSGIILCIQLYQLLTFVFFLLLKILFGNCWLYVLGNPNLDA